MSRPITNWHTSQRESLTRGQRAADTLRNVMGSWPFVGGFLAVMGVWAVLNVTDSAWDPYPFILLNLAFSTQAAYAAPLILLAQNRQENRDRVSLEEDRRRAEQTKADTEYLARELASLRLAVGEVATRDYLRRELDEIRDLLNEMRPPEATDGGKDGPAKSHSSERRSKKLS